MKTRIIGEVVKKGIGRAVIITQRKITHPIYGKQYKVTKKMHIQDPENLLKVGDIAEAEETRPLSKTIHWKLTKIR